MYYLCYKPGYNEQKVILNAEIEPLKSNKNGFLILKSIELTNKSITVHQFNLANSCNLKKTILIKNKLYRLKTRPGYNEPLL